MKLIPVVFTAACLAVLAFPAHAAPTPTPEQQGQIENCKILSGAVFQFAEARDRKQSKMDAFKSVTHGQTYVPGSLLDETLQWAFARHDEQPDTASAHFYGRCVLDAYEVLNPDSEGELDVSAMACQQAHPDAPDAVRDCIDTTAHDIVARVQSTAQSAVAAAATSAPPAGATVLAAVPAPSSTSVAAPQATTPLPQSTPAAPVPVLAATPAVETPAPVVAPVASVVQPAPAPPREVTPVVPAVPVPGPVVADAQVPEAVTPVTAPPAVMLVTPSPPPVAAKAAAPAPVVARAAAPQPVAAPLMSSRSAVTKEYPPNLTGFGKLTVGMPMEDAYKALGSHGETDQDEQGEVHTYMIGNDHGFMELRPSGSGRLYSIRVVGGADAHVAPVMNVVLGDAAFLLINAVGLPSSRAPLPGDKELWNYRERNYAFEISPGGDVIGLRITDTSDDQSAAQ